jgi:hypothetical protein
MKLLLLTMLCILSVHADTLTYQLNGTYEPQTKNIKYIINWKERDGSIKGFYQDDSLIAKALVTGKRTSDGRVMEITFPSTSYGATGLRIKTIPVKGAQTVTVPVVMEILGDKKRTLELKAKFVGKP